MHPPSVDALARRLADTGLPHPNLVAAARQAIAELRDAADATEADYEERARLVASTEATASLRPVINATGVLLHTNMGRAPMGFRRNAGYSNLELDLATGERGSRSDHAGRLLARAAGAEAATVVNNGAAAVLLALAALARGRDVVVSRGELVEIGGGFRIPEVMATSGARLVEVGTTNRTRVDDYRAAVEANDVAVVLKVHPSNYRIEGFTAEASVAELAELGPPVVMDAGSGLLDASTPWLVDGPPAWLGDEPAVRQTLDAGAALVTFSGDKLLGGPQAGIIAGRADLVAACASHPLARALRPGGLVLEALQETALAYLRRDGDAIPLWRMVALPVESLRNRAERLAADLEGWRAEPTTAVPGGGSSPGAELASFGLLAEGDVRAALRAAEPPVMARVRDDQTIVDLRTVAPEQDDHLGAALRAAAPTR